MAIGVRITSENLSGKTATVTFVPYTGSTSGSSENLGSKTIPFNNINSHPYGVYSLYFEEYDYTYTLTVSEPTFNVESYVLCAPLSGGSTNYGIGFLNFDDITATVLDIGVDSTVWEINDIYPLQEKGYAYHFHLIGDWNTRQVVFTDYENTVLGTYSGVTSDWSYDVMDGVWNIVYDLNDGFAHYSNGENVYTYTWDPILYQFDFDWNNYAVNADKGFIITLFNNDTSTITSYNVSYTNQITELESWVYPVVKNYFQSPSHTFIPSVEWDGNNNQYDNIKFFNTDGTQIGSTISLTGNTYDNYSYEQYGMNRFVIVFWNNSDVNIDYTIIHFDGETNNVINTTKTRGYNYQSLIMRADNNNWPTQQLSTCLYMTFCNITNWYYDIQTDYCDIVYMLGNQTSLNTYQFTNGTTVYFDDTTPGDGINIPFVDGDQVVKVLSFNNSGAQIVTTSIPSNGADKYYWYWNLNGLGFITIAWADNYSSGDILHIGTPGNLTNNLPFTLSNSWEFNVNATNGIFYFTDRTDTFYINTTSNGFVTLTGETYNNTYYSYYGTTDMVVNDMLLLYDYNSRNGRLLTSTSISNVLNFPNHNGNWEMRLGKDYVMYTYGDYNTNQTTVKLYDENLTEINSMVTIHTNGWNNTYAAKDRYVLTVSDGGNIYVYMITSSTSKSIILLDGNNDDAPNDFYYWAD